MLYNGYGMKPDWENAALSEDELLSGYRINPRYLDLDGRLIRHPCPGDEVRGCGVSILITSERCHFCTKTIRLRDEDQLVP